MLPLTVVAPIFALAPEHIVVLLPAFAAGSALVVIVFVAVSLDVFPSVVLFGFVVYTFNLLLPDAKLAVPRVMDAVLPAFKVPVQL